MGTGRLPGGQRGRSRRGWFPVLRLVAVAAFLAGAWYRLGAVPPAGPGVPEPPRGPVPLALRVAPATWEAGRPNRVSISSQELKPEEVGRDLFLAVPELGWTRRVSPKVLRRGILEEFRPDTPGLFRVRVFSNGIEVGSRWVAVTPAGERVTRDHIWRLKAGPPHLLASGAFEIPIYAAVERDRDGVTVPTLIGEGERLTLEDSDSGKTLGLLRIPSRQALSNRLGVPIDPGKSYRLVASNHRGSILAGPLPLDWNRNGPRLRLAATPDRQDATAGLDTGATVGLYLTFEGRPVVPSRPTPVEVDAPGNVRIEPTPPLMVGPDSPVVTCRLTCPGIGNDTGRDATIRFREPGGETDCAVAVRFAFPWPFFALAAVSGGIAVLAARRGNPATRSLPRWRAWAEVLVGGAAAEALYVAVLSGRFRTMAGCPLGLDAPVAMLIGLAGGLLGLAASDLLLGPARVPSRAGTGSMSQAPPAPPALAEPPSTLGNIA